MMEVRLPTPSFLGVGAMEAAATTLGSWMVEGAGSEQQRLEGAVQTLARSRDIMAQVQELLPVCFPEGVRTTEGLVQQISGSVSRALTALTSHGGGNPQFEDNRKSRRSQGGSSGRSGMRRVSAKKSSPSKRNKHVYVTTQIMKLPLIEDGFMWKKYGQKNIKFAKHPRNYFRCSQSSSNHCPMVKLVQQTNDGISMYAVTYIGHHTCQDPLLDYEDDNHHKGVTINFASRYMDASTSRATTSLLFSQYSPQRWPVESMSEVLQPIISKKTVEIHGSFNHITTNPSCPTATHMSNCIKDEGSPTSSGSLPTGFGNTFEDIWFSDEEDFLLR